MTATATVSSQPLVVTGARKQFGAVQALAGASLDLRPGELLGLLGPNGAGKTTLIKAIAGRLQLDAGDIVVFGRKVRPADARPEIGLVPQELAVYTKLTARENLEVFGRLNGVRGGDLHARVQWALGWADLAARAREPVARFSGGMRRRLNIACSLLHSPTLVLLDEPTVGVDPQSRERIYEMLASLRASGVSIVLTTHHLEEAEDRCDRIVIIDHGKTVAAGSLAEILRSTLGTARALEIRLAAAWPEGAALPGGARLSADGRQISATVEDLARDVSRVLDPVGRSGLPIADVTLTRATLQNAFIALTGRELRE